jgi:uncharacterized protein YbbC (DUF1343 family)
MLDGLDLFVVDLQDVGTRVYTFIWTVTYYLEACAEAGIPVLVLDRPNPIGGVDILTGSDRARVAIDAGLTTTGLEELCEVDEAWWVRESEMYRLYT